MRTLAALLIALPLAAAGQEPAPDEAPPEEPSAEAVPAAPDAPQGPARSGWYIGFGVGSGRGRFTDLTGTSGLARDLTSPWTVFLEFKVGAVLTPRLLLGVDVAVLSTNGTVPAWRGTPYVASRDLTNVDLMLTWFPAQSGFFLRGGLGVSNLAVEVETTPSDDVDGTNLTLGAGYAFLGTGTFALTLNLDFSTQRFHSNEEWAPSRAGAWALWMGFDWY